MGRNEGARPLELESQGPERSSGRGSAAVGVSDRLFSAVLCVAVATGLLLVASAAEAVCVDPDSSGCVATVQEGVDATPAGGTVELGKGTFFENVVIPAGKDGITIRGRSHKRTIVDADDPNTGAAFLVQAHNVTIESLGVHNGLTEGIRAEPGINGLAVRKARFRGPNGDCVNAIGNNVEVSKTRMEGCGGHGVSVIGDDAMLVSNRLERCGNDCIEIRGDNVLIEKNKILLSDVDCIDVRGASATVSKNRMTVCADDGAQIDGDFATVEKNQVKVVDDEGIDVNPGDGSGEGPLVSGNKIFNAEDTSISVTCFGGCTTGLIERNKGLFTAERSGLEIDFDGSGLVVAKNKMLRTREECFRLAGAGVDVVKNRAKECGSASGGAFVISGDGHTVQSNVATKSAGDGFTVGGQNHLLKSNKAIDNLKDGFDVGGNPPSTATNIELVSNVAKKNDGEGIEVGSSASGINLRGNIAVKNRTDYCDEGQATVGGEGNNRFSTTGPCEVD